jgi:hypothetical protein
MEMGLGVVSQGKARKVVVVSVFMVGFKSITNFSTSDLASANWSRQPTQQDDHDLISSLTH